MRARVGVYAVAVDDGRLLLAKLAGGGRFAHHWTLPGGGMEHGETAMETLRREVLEETGLVPMNPVPLGTASMSGDEPEPWMTVQVLYRCEVAGEPRVVEVDGTTVEARWVPLDEVGQLTRVGLVDEALKHLPSPKVGPWESVRLRIPGGWAVRHHGLDVRRRGDGSVAEVNDSEDLMWLERLPPPGKTTWPAAGPWRARSIDVGWYRDHFRLVVLDPDWDHIAATVRTTSLDEVICVLEAWLLRLPD